MNGRPTDAEDGGGHHQVSRLQNSNERTPLLAGDRNEDESISARITNDGNSKRTEWQAELWILTKLTLPMWITHLLEYSITGTTVFVMGHLGAEE